MRDQTRIVENLETKNKNDMFWKVCDQHGVFLKTPKRVKIYKNVITNNWTCDMIFNVDWIVLVKLEDVFFSRFLLLLHQWVIKLRQKRYSFVMTRNRNQNKRGQIQKRKRIQCRALHVHRWLKAFPFSFLQ